MKNLALLLLIVVAGCRRQAVVTTAPPASQPTSTAGLNAPGGATHRDALQKFMAAAKAQDIQAVSNVWGSSKGAARTDRTYMTVEQMEQRIIIMLRCLRHDTYAIKAETEAVGGGRTFNVEVKKGSAVSVADFGTTPGPDNRFYVNAVQMDKLQAICMAQ